MQRPVFTSGETASEVCVPDTQYNHSCALMCNCIHTALHHRFWMKSSTNSGLLIPKAVSDSAGARHPFSLNMCILLLRIRITLEFPLNQQKNSPNTWFLPESEPDCQFLARFHMHGIILCLIQISWYELSTQNQNFYCVWLLFLFWYNFMSCLSNNASKNK